MKSSAGSSKTQKTLRKKQPKKPENPGAKFGHIPGIPVGKRWDTRKAMSVDHVHPPLIAGIYGRRGDGARSVVIGSEFADEDHGDHFVYIGSGGKDTGVRFGPQVHDQDFNNHLNESLRMSAHLKRPVRVIRGSGSKSKYAPQVGYRYDGLYLASNPRIEEGPNGLKVCKFDFNRMPDQSPIGTEPSPDYYRSDIEVRRQMYRDARKASAKAREDRPSGSTSEASSSRSGSQDIFVDDNSEGYDDDVFGDTDDVEEAMEPVAHLLDEIAKGGRSEEEKKRNSFYLLHIGRHVTQVLQEKSRGARDEGGRDFKWWYDALWCYVGAYLPVNKTIAPEWVEAQYKKREAKVQAKKTQDRESSSTDA